MSKAAAKPEIANSLSSILSTSPVARLCCQKGTSHEEMSALADKVSGMWELDLYSRKPSPALNSHGEFTGTDLDLATFMSALAARSAVIQIPTYRNMRAKTEREGERHLKGPRTGKIMAIYANKEVFSFGVRIFDNTIVQMDPDTGHETIGAPRNFSLVNVKGEWHEGWRSIEFQPHAPENSFLNDHKLWTDSSVIFNNFVHPNRWQTFYSRAYLETKLLIQSLTDRAAYLRAKVKELEAAGIPFPDTNNSPTNQPVQSPAKKVSEDTPVKITAFLAELDLPQDPVGAYPEIPATPTGKLQAHELAKKWSYGVIPSLTFAIRAVELAYFQKGLTLLDAETGEVEERLPHWVEDLTWEKNVVLPGKRIKWNALKIPQDGVGMKPLTLRYRVYPKTERLHAE